MHYYFLGLDLGGTNVKAGLTDHSGRLLSRVSVPTGQSGLELAPRPVIERMVDAANKAILDAGLKHRQVAAVGVLSPGQADLEKGVVIRASNLPLWKNVLLRAQVSKALSIPAILENDANAAAYGEWWTGAGKSGHLQNLFLFTLGTGVGGGLIYDGNVVRGSSGFAAEIGHSIIIPDGELCGCGQHGCLERYCSAKYTGHRASRLLAASPRTRRHSSLGPLFKSHGSVSSHDIALHAQAGDPFALEIWDETCRLLALACINVCHFIDPEMIVLGGGMSKAGNFLLRRVQHHFRDHWWKMTKPTAKIVLAKLGNDAGIIGAAGVAKEALACHTLPKIGQ
jgi:glucokinase